MRKIILFGSLLLLTCIFTNAQIIMDENFDYPAGDSLGAHGWVSFSGGNTNVLTVISPGLVFSGYPLSGIGNATRVRSTGQDAYKQFSADSMGSVYFAMMVRVDSAKTGDYFAALLPNNSTTNYTARTYVKDTLGSLYFGISKSSSSNGPIVYTSSSWTYNTTLVLIVKYTFNTGTTTDDEMRLWVFGSTIPGTEPSPHAGPVTGTITDAPNISRIALRQGTSSSSPVIQVDGIRVFKSWSNIVFVRTLSTVAESFNLKQNYPNPFNPSTSIEFSLPKNSFVELDVFDALGRKVKSLVSENLRHGVHKVEFISSDFSSGSYFYTINARTDDGEVFRSTKSMVLIK